MGIIRKIANIVFPILLGGLIIWWMYRGFDFSKVMSTMRSGMDWGWMLFSLVFGVTAQMFRGLRWRLSLDPVGEHPRVADCIHAVFLSYASSLVIPRSGEVVRCGVLKRYDGTSVSKSLGTVLTERVIDSLLIILVTIVVFLCQIGTFRDFFSQTGTNLSSWLATFTGTGWMVTILCIVITLVFLYVLARHITGLRKLRQIAEDLKAGIFSLKDVEDKGLFTFYTIAIWVSYFLHFYIAFFSFSFTSDLPLITAAVAFIIGSIAVIVPTPNGMGPWHFAVKTILVLYGVTAFDAELFVMIVWAVQTALIPVLGAWSLICLSGRRRTPTAAAGHDRRSVPHRLRTQDLP
ncbi:MAG: flippase-like domain-containing protein [Bacteroidaceae bacterium]|nr:flippase-like domain-containing protein [Bacteroidaceae bacterium]